MKYIIDRQVWYRGKGATGSALLREEDGHMCCLGQVALQCGLTEAEIIGEGEPEDIRQDATRMPTWLLRNCGESDGCAVFGNSPDCCEAMDVNDCEAVSDGSRENRLKRIFAKHGDELEFIN